MKESDQITKNSIFESNPNSNKVVISRDSSSLSTTKDEPQNRDELSLVSIQIGAFGSTLIRIRDLGIQTK